MESNHDSGIQSPLSYP